MAHGFERLSKEEKELWAKVSLPHLCKEKKRKVEKRETKEQRRAFLPSAKKKKKRSKQERDKKGGPPSPLHVTARLASLDPYRLRMLAPQPYRHPLFLNQCGDCVHCLRSFSFLLPLKKT
eukprot:scaffold105652_cov14-Tisochrysis_lutea.AAC.1